jgi:hypothetical protein
MFDATNDITFAMISQSGSDGNAWGNGGSAGSIVVPIGVFGVEDVWTMLNDLGGTSLNNGTGGNNDTTLTFTFDSAANGSVAATSTVVTVKLRDGVEIAESIVCASGCSSPETGYGTGLAPSTSFSNSNTSVNGGSSFNTPVTVVTDQLFSAAYTGGGPYANTSGNLVLDDQGFEFGSAFSNLYLVSVGVSNIQTTAGDQTFLSAITVVNAPEPSTVLLFLSGLGALGFARFRRK